MERAPGKHQNRAQGTGTAHPIPERIFKAYDVRGIYPSEVNERVVAEIARVLAAHWKRASRSKRKPVIVVGHDARLSSPSLYRAIVKTLYPIPYTLIKAGMVTTPMFYFLVNDLQAAGGIMVTASHNPKEFNGIKAVGLKAEPISGKEVWEMVMGMK